MIKYYYPDERIAVVAMGGLFPDAVNVDSLWNNIISKKVSIREIPDHLFDKKVFYRPEVLGKANKGDKSYTKVAAIPEMNDFSALTRKYRIPPAVAEYMDPNQLTIIYSVDQAIQQMKSNISKERTAVILGIGAPGINFENVTRRTFFARVENALRSHAQGASGAVLSQLDEIIKETSEEVLKNTLTITEDSTTGYLQNIMAARVSNIFDFWGPSYTIDAACASTLAAVASGVTGLLNGEFDTVITGGSEVTMSEVGLAAFSGINALSPDGEYPFDSRANGFVMGLGGGVLILKRLSDALRDGDHIISIISGYGQGSDGKGKYIAAPSEEGQVRVIQDACKMAGYSADTIEFIEAHGTGTIVGDVVEVSALKKAFKNMGVERQNFCGIGSVKSNIGHLRNAAGSVSMIKASLSLYHKVLPPTANIREINPKLQLEGSPFYILTDGKQWNETAAHPRRANVSAYGFGGADYHICLEEFRPEFVSKTYPVSMAEKLKTSISTVQNTDNGEEPVFFSGESFEDIKNAFKEFINANTQSPDFRNAVFLNNSCVSCNKDWRLAICSDSFEGLKQKWDVFEKFINENDIKNTYLLNSKGIFLGTGKGMSPCETAWMFPGQASQYPNMLSEIYESYPSVKSFYMQADTIWKAKFGYSVLPLIFGDNEEVLKSELKNTKNTHPAIFLSNIALFKLLSESGIKADYMIGHSLGEITSLYASGMLDLKSAIELIGARGYSFDGIPPDERGQMVSIKSDRSSVAELIEKNSLNVCIANINSRDQIVVGGKKDEITKLTEILSTRKMTYTLLQVSHAFHTDITRGAADNFYSKIKGIKFNLPKAEVMCCHVSGFYPSNVEEIGNIPGLLKDQIVSPVNFADSVLKLYEKGVRLFIEAGPSSVLTNLVKNILAGKDVKIIASNYKNKSSVEAYKYVLAELFTCGVDISMVPSDGLPGSEYEEPAARNTGNIDEGYNKLSVSYVSVEKPLGKESLVYSGASVGLPGTFKKAFSDDNFDIIFEGNNLIEMLTDEEQSSVLDQNITRLLKTEGVTTFKKITSLNEVIHLAGKFGQLDMMKDYLIDGKLLKQMTLTVCAGVAAGYEVLKDAGIPLVREYIRTTSGAVLPGRLVLPEEMRDDTGIIFASGLWPLESVIGEVSKYVANKFGGKTRNDLIDFYGAVISKISDRDAKKTLSDWFTLHYSRLKNGLGEEDIYEFNHNFMLLLSSQANNRLAQFIGAAGPNLYVSAACSSTASAVTVAEDMIRAGHARRVIVIGADLASIKNTLPWFAGGFLSMGALTDSSDLLEAAVPFDNRRNGMILGAGAVGLMVEKEEDVAKRGMNGICRILGTHMFNSAGHQTRIDSNKYCIELDRFIAKMENEHGIDRNKIASRTVYSSHETCSPRVGGCSETEKMAMEYTFKDKYDQLKVISTKGITGHTMGASIEEAVAAKALQYQKIPPVVNYREPDPELKGLNLSQGGSYDFDYVLRSVIAFGGQGNYHLLQGIARGDERITDKKAYHEWLEKITSSKNAELSYQGRILTAEGDGKPGLKNEKERAVNVPVHATEVNIRHENKAPQKEFTSDITDGVLEIYSQITKYPKEMLEPSMEMEADLGIDTVKQATIFSMLSEKYGLSQQDIALSNYPTIGHIIGLISEKAGIVKTAGNLSEEACCTEESATEDFENEVLKVISEITRYPAEMLEKDMEMEADLGIDTVKQATIFSIIGEKFDMSEEEAAGISHCRTIGEVVNFVWSKMGKKAGGRGSGIKGGNSHKAGGLVSKRVGMPEMTGNSPETICGVQYPAAEDFENEVLKVISEITRYPVEMLEKDMEMEADLGIDTVKQATIFSIIGEKFDMSEEEAADISRCRTISEVMDFVWSKIDKKTGRERDKSCNSHEAMPAVSSVKPAEADSRLKNDYESVKNQVLELISEVTRYPVEMLENEMELEADLGIDTIKQATIFSAISDRFGVDEKEIRRVSEFKTIGAIVEMIKESVKSDVTEPLQEIIETAQDEASAASFGILPEEEPAERELCLQIPVFEEEAIVPKDYDLKDKHIWVIGDTANIVKNASEYFKKISGSTEEFVFEGCSDIAELEERIAGFVNNTVDVIVDVNSLGMCMEYERLSRDEEERMLFLKSQARFVFYKKLSEHISEPEIRIVCAVSMDGNHGCSKLSKGAFNPFEGAVCGFYKGLRKEWVKSKVKIIDLDIAGDLNISDGVMVRLRDELEASSDEYEIGYTEGRRVAFKVDCFDRKEFNEIKLPDMPHFVITGGGNGIAAEIITGLAGKVRGKFTIIGRTALPENIEQLSSLSEERLEQKKHEIRNILKKTGETASPVAVEREYEKLRKAVSVHKLINTVRAKGSDILYFECDVRDYESLEKVINEATEKNGPVHAVIHAAGVEKSRLLAQKTLEEFRDIFSVKAHGLCNLYRVIDKKELKVFIGFSSISGRFGNEAQLDYCSANSFISSFISMIKSKHSEIHALSVAWSGWKDTGMAWRNEFVRQNSEEMGINLIEPDRGTAEFIRILTGGTDRNEIIVSKGLSHFITPGMTYGKTDETPQIDWVVKDDGKLYKAFKVLSVKRDPIINNHRLGKTPLMPAVGFMEILAEYHSLVFGKKEQYCFKNIRLEKPLKLFNEKPQEIMLVPGHLNEPDEIEGVFYTHFQLKNTAPELIKLNSMQVSGTMGDYDSLLDLRNVESGDMVEFLCYDNLDIYKEKTYNSIHLGTLFADDRCKAYNRFKYNESAAVYPVLLPEEQITNSKYRLEKLLINPVFMDTLMQICGIHSAHTTGRVYLPWEIGEFGIVKVPREAKPYRAYTKLKYRDDEVRSYDVLLLDENEEVCSHVKDVKMRRISV